MRSLVRSPVQLEELQQSKAVVSSLNEHSLLVSPTKRLPLHKRFCYVLYYLVCAFSIWLVGSLYCTISDLVMKSLKIHGLGILSFRDRLKSLIKSNTVQAFCDGFIAFDSYRVTAQKLFFSLRATTTYHRINFEWIYHTVTIDIIISSCPEKQNSCLSLLHL